MTPDQAAIKLTGLGPENVDQFTRIYLVRARQAIRDDARDNFDKSRGPDGEVWPGLRFPRPRGGTKPLLDTGILRASVISTGKYHTESQTADTLRMGTEAPFAYVQQHGATILPVNAKALAIPLTREAQLAGSPRKFPRPLLMLWAKGDTSGVLVEIPPPKARKKNEPPKRVAHYALVGRAVVPARAFLGFGERLIKRLVAIGERLITTAFGG